MQETTINANSSAAAEVLPGVFATKVTGSRFHQGSPLRDRAQLPAFIPLARTITVWASAAIFLMTALALAFFYTQASSQQERAAAQYANAKAEGIARSLDVFDQTMKLNAENAFGVFRRQFGPTLALDDASQGTLTNYGGPINDNTTEVDGFARDFPGGNATVFVAQGEDFRRITTSVMKENGERVVGALLDRQDPAYATVRAGEKFVGRARSEERRVGKECRSR